MRDYSVKLSSVTVPLPPERVAAYQYAMNWIMKFLLEPKTNEQSNRAGDADHRPDAHS